MQPLTYAVITLTYNIKLEIFQTNNGHVMFLPTVKYDGGSMRAFVSENLDLSPDLAPLFCILKHTLKESILCGDVKFAIKFLNFIQRKPFTVSVHCV